jgi:hypothetical protein
MDLLVVEALLERDEVRRRRSVRASRTCMYMVLGSSADLASREADKTALAVRAERPPHIRPR